MEEAWVRKNIETMGKIYMKEEEGEKVVRKKYREMFGSHDKRKLLD